MALKLLSTGVPGLDEVLGGGLPEYSFNLLAGAPGCGKTTLVHQLTFANATEQRPALYCTVVGEPPLKMLRYQQQMEFFDPSKIGTAIRFVDLSPEVLAGDLSRVLEKIVHEVQSHAPAIVIVDSFRTVLHARHREAGEGLELSGFLQKLALHLTTWQVTSFLVGEYAESEMADNPVFTVADGIVWLTQHRERNSVVRKLEVTKMRGVAALAGLHTFRISRAGVQIFPRSGPLSEQEARPRPSQTERARFDIPALDHMLGGGVPRGDSTLVAGPSGTGKTALGTHFIAAGLRAGEAGVLALFEEHPSVYRERARAMGLDLDASVAAGKLRLLYLPPLDLSCDEILRAVQHAVRQVGATRLVLDSLNGLELSLAPTSRDEFRESLYRLIGQLTDGGVSVLLTMEVNASLTELKFTPHSVSFLAQNILFMRYVEVDTTLRKLLTVVKMRRSQHSHELTEFEITPHGVSLLGPLRGARALPGHGESAPAGRRERLPGLLDSEQRLYDELEARGPRSREQLARLHEGTAEALSAALARLCALAYAAASSDAAGQTYYHAVARQPSAPSAGGPLPDGTHDVER